MDPQLIVTWLFIGGVVLLLAWGVLRFMVRRRRPSPEVGAHFWWWPFFVGAALFDRGEDRGSDGGGSGDGGYSGGAEGGYGGDFGGGADGGWGGGGDFGGGAN